MLHSVHLRVKENIQPDPGKKESLFHPPLSYPVSQLTDLSCTHDGGWEMPCSGSLSDGREGQEIALSMDDV